MAPSESSRSKLTRVAARSAASRSADPAAASVVSTTSMVASPGASMPAPLAIPPTVNPGPATTTVLGTLSVVMMARAAAGPPSRASASWAASTPAVILSIGSSSPMRPVEQTAMSSASTPSRAATWPAVARVSAKPAAPVQALAPPELSTTAASCPRPMISSHQRTGAALTRLVVNTPAASYRGPSLTTRATSGSPDDLSPAATPAARKPAGAVTVTGRVRSWRVRWSRGTRARG